MTEKEAIDFCKNNPESAAKIILSKRAEIISQPTTFKRFYSMPCNGIEHTKVSRQTLLGDASIVK